MNEATNFKPFLEGFVSGAGRNEFVLCICCGVVIPCALCAQQGLYYVWEVVAVIVMSNWTKNLICFCKM